MDHQRVSRDVLRRAAEAVGGEEALAKALGCTLNDRRAWLHDEADVPLNVYLEACRLLSEK
jgi:hypothetical protein